MNELPSPLERRIAALESRVAKLVEKLDRKGPQPVKPEPDAPEGYRRFTLGERIQHGDVFLRCDGKIEPAVSIGWVPIAAYKNYFRPIAQDPEPIAKPRRSPVQIAKERLARYDTETFSAVALEALIVELTEEGYE